jgi:hypothetical protein
MEYNFNKLGLSISEQHMLHKRRESSVDIAAGYRLYGVHTGSGAHLASYPVDTDAVSLRVMWAGT